MTFYKQVVRRLFTLLVIAAAATVSFHLWRYYTRTPWTRDARVRADVATIAPDVSGLVDTVNVHDNQFVSKGDVLFTIDRRRFEIARSRAIAAIQQIDAEILLARRENGRNQRLGNLVSDEAREESQTKLDQEMAARSQAQAVLDEAELNLDRSVVTTPISGIVTNIELQPGDYATTGRPEFAVLATDSLRVEGYFEETKLRGIHPGDQARISLMGDDRVISGHVESIAIGVEDRDRASSARFLANINPTFNWVRLAQRIPVRIKLDQLPRDTALISGRTATVEVLPDKADSRP
ncbi:efflux RND transporter periplasmic adaptor subunit [Dyella soli]|uniref:Efflux RND transporter periplasmic adaptor subunit n=1 Tax=Dyella soli TaxID=522319 RepID=A0A4R0YLE3_9GAMM|nr:efflux RND transporter periplasmic adaptor subunit [Dyella soli]TCI09657.1 efflux RND transporter periplasmic adaptor subunit [Dyella soli]